MSATLQRHAIGLTWTEPGTMVRSAHALRSEDRVWLVDPFDDGPALAEAESLGTIAGVFQLLDRHNRDCETIADRSGVPLLRLPAAAPDSPFEVVPVLSRWGWHEVALWWERERALVVAEAIGTAPPFALGRRAGVHPLLRLTPPRSQLAPYRPSILLVGHGATVETDAASALDDALGHSRADIPRLVTSLPNLIRSR
ncbi:MAG TPA: hypothetical protein VMJ65_10100 [Solirubrobacteraceae bacterium]|nr:hypothetical protein [Solirubrobacteraceae bacterium]